MSMQATLTQSPVTKAITDAIEELISNSDFYEPVSLYAGIIGKAVSFKTTDTEGNSITSEDLFSSNKITMKPIRQTSQLSRRKAAGVTPW